MTKLIKLFTKHGTNLLILFAAATMFMNNSDKIMSQPHMQTLNKYVSKISTHVSGSEIEKHAYDAARMVTARVNVAPLDLSRSFKSKSRSFSRSSGGNLAVNHGPIFIR